MPPAPTSPAQVGRARGGSATLLTRLVVRADRVGGNPEILHKAACRAKPGGPAGDFGKRSCRDARLWSWPISGPSCRGWAFDGQPCRRWRCSLRKLCAAAASSNSFSLAVRPRRESSPVFWRDFSCHACIRCGVPLRAAVAGISAVVAGRQIAGRAFAAVHAALRVTRGQDGAGCRRLESAFRWLLRIWSSWPDADWPRLAEVRYALGL